MKAVSNIKRITKTMQMIATARFQASQKRAVQARPYTQKIGQLVEQLAAASGSVTHPLLAPPPESPGRELMLVLTSDRGLCGGYNANILRTAWKQREQALEDRELELEVVGKKGKGYFKFNRVPVDTQHTQFGEKPAYPDVEALADRYINDYLQGKYDRVRVVYMAFHSASRQAPEALTLLPMQKPDAAEGIEGQDAGTGPQADYEFSPDAESLLAELLPAAVRTRLFQCFNEAVVSEQVARMIAMKAATDAAGRMRKDLSRSYNRARQAAITTELTEIIAGAASVE